MDARKGGLDDVFGLDSAGWDFFWDFRWVSLPLWIWTVGQTGVWLID
jgi:hypothetical protein